MGSGKAGLGLLPVALPQRMRSPVWSPDDDVAGWQRVSRLVLRVRRLRHAVAVGQVEVRRMGARADVDGVAAWSADGGNVDVYVAVAVAPAGVARVRVVAVHRMDVVVLGPADAGCTLPTFAGFGRRRCNAAEPTLWAPCMRSISWGEGRPGRLERCPARRDPRSRRPSPWPGLQPARAFSRTRRWWCAPRALASRARACSPGADDSPSAGGTSVRLCIRRWPGPSRRACTPWAATAP